jgi:inosose dehydratase
MTIRFGVSPIAWINDDMPELGGDTPVEAVLADIRKLGFAGVELGGAFPREPAALAALLGAHDLALVGGWYSSALLDHSAEAEIARMQPHLDLLLALGSSVFICAETSNAIHGKRGTPMRNRPILSDSGWARFGERLTVLADHVAALGLRFAYHHHLGTVVESGRDLDHFLASTGPAVGLTLDTGHAMLGGIDPVAVIGRHPDRIAHVHCKDVRQPVFDDLHGRDASFLDGVLAGMFTVPGDGRIDYDAVMAALQRIGYRGWVILEAEQDPARANPFDYAALGLRTLAGAAAAAGVLCESAVA